MKSLCAGLVCLTGASAHRAYAQTPAEAAPPPAAAPVPPPQSAPPPRPPEANANGNSGPAGRPPVRQAQPNGLPPAPRELTPAEVAALQTAMTDRSANAILTPGNVAAIRDRMIDTQAALGHPGYSDEPTPTPRARSVTITSQQSAIPQELHLALGLVTPITVLDSRGRPWPIASVAYDPRILAEEGIGCGTPPAPPPMGVPRPTTIHLMPCKISSWGNISIQLENYPLPIVFMVKSGTRGTRVVDLPVTVKVEGASPAVAAARSSELVAEVSPSPSVYAAARNLNASAAGAPDTTSSVGGAVVSPAVGAEPIVITGRGRRERGGHRRVVAQRGFHPDRVLDLFAAGTPPRGAERATVDDPRISAWIYHGSLYLRGAVTVVNPAYDEVADRSAGVRVWRFSRPASRLLVLDDSGTEHSVSVDF